MKLRLTSDMSLSGLYFLGKAKTTSSHTHIKHRSTKETQHLSSECTVFKRMSVCVCVCVCVCVVVCVCVCECSRALSLSLCVCVCVCVFSPTVSLIVCVC